MLHMYENETDIFVAESLEAANDMAVKFYADFEWEALRLVPDDKPIMVPIRDDGERCEAGEPYTKTRTLTAAEWCALEGEGHFGGVDD